MIDEAVAAIDIINLTFEVLFLLIGAPTLTTLTHPRLILPMKTRRLRSQLAVPRPVHETTSCYRSATIEHNSVLKSQPLYDRVRGLARWRLQHGGRSGERLPTMHHVQILTAPKAARPAIYWPYVPVCHPPPSSNLSLQVSIGQSEHTYTDERSYCYSHSHSYEDFTGEGIICRRSPHRYTHNN